MENYTKEQLQEKTKEDLMKLKEDVTAYAAAQVSDIEQALIEKEQQASAVVKQAETAVLTWAERFRKSQGLSVEMFILQIVVFATILMKVFWR